MRPASQGGASARLFWAKIANAHSPTAIPNAIAAFLLHLRDTTGQRPRAYFNWGENHPLLYLVGYLLSGHGDIAPVTREVLRQAELEVALRLRQLIAWHRVANGA